ncbi:MAG: hypothetical protein ACLQED_01995 [Desulfobaccales bacterium]
MYEYLKRAVEMLHHCQAFFMEDAAVVQKFGEQTVWSGVVSFSLIKGHAQADKCYEWSSPIDGSTIRRYYAVLHSPPLDFPKEAVRVSIVFDLKGENAQTGKVLKGLPIRIEKSLGISYTSRYDDYA